MKAEVLSIGTELLLGEVTDTNSREISEQLEKVGINVYHKSTVGDNKQRIIGELNTAFERSDIVITTGGLGPTRDDLTKEAAAEFLGREMFLDEETVSNLKAYFEPRGLTVNEGNKRQAYFPVGSTILPNANGTAPGLILRFDGKERSKISQPFEQERHLIILPGPPREMRPMLQEQVMPYLERLTGKIFVSKTFSLAGIGEGHMEEKIIDLIRLQTNPSIAPYAKEKGLTLRIMAQAETEEEAQRLLHPVEEEIRRRLSGYIYAEREVGLEEVVADYLKEHRLTLATAESCSGGLLAARMIDVPGISSVFKQGFITYSNEAKRDTLRVCEETLNTFGAVSEQTACEMAQGAAKRAGSDIGVSITGIAGPGGGTEEKPVGLVYLGVHAFGQTKAKKVFIKGPREYIRRRSVSEALYFLKTQLRDKNEQ